MIMYLYESNGERNQEMLFSI